MLGAQAPEDSSVHPHRLTPKEFTVLKLLAQGLGTAAIAEQIGIGPRSVQNHITNLRRKLGCVERTQLLVWYRQRYGDCSF